MHGLQDVHNPMFLGISPAIRRVEAEANRLLASQSPIFIHGETGVGKGLLARWLHQHGPRSQRSLIDLNCATLGRELLESELFGHAQGAFTGAVTSTPGLLEIAHGGTAFLDEVGDLDPSVQPKLLKVVEEKRYRRLGDVVDRPVDVRLITATHQNLEQLADTGKFRRDLFYRICVLPLYVPSLRERTEDIPLLARYFLERLSADLDRPKAELTDGAMSLLLEHSWPGNIRELKTSIERALLNADTPIIGCAQLAFLNRRERSTSAVSDTAARERAMTLIEAERLCIQDVLHTVGGRVDLAALKLGISRSSLYNKIKKHRLGAA